MMSARVGVKPVLVAMLVCMLPGQLDAGPMQESSGHTSRMLTFLEQGAKGARHGSAWVISMRGGGLMKKFKKGLSLNAEEKAYCDRVHRLGLSRVMMEDEGPTRRELAVRDTEKEEGEKGRKNKLAQRSDKIKADTRKKLASLDGEKPAAPVGIGCPHPMFCRE